MISTPYQTRDGRVAFVVDQYQYGFEVRAMSRDGGPLLTRMAVNQCKDAQLIWDGQRSLRFTYAYAEIAYLADVPLRSDDLSIVVCREDSPTCQAHPVSEADTVIEVSCG